MNIIGEHMKKILKAIALIVCLVFPLSAMAMSTIADNELSSVTGQSGVSINLDVNMDVTATTIAWGDSDGFSFASPSTNFTNNTQLAGWVGLSNLTVSGLRIQARQDLLNTAYANVAGAANFPTSGSILIGQYNAAHTTSGTFPANIGTALTDTSLAGWGLAYTNFNSYNAYTAASGAFLPLTIDVATGVAHGAGVTYVRIGLGSIQATMASMDADVKVGTSNSLVGLSPNYDDTFGSLYVGNMTVLVNGNSSYVDIYKGSGAQGVVFNLNVVLDTITIGTVAWGDANGLGVLIAGNPAPAGWVTGTAQGWVGLKNLTIGSLSVIGPVNIDVATDAGQTFVNIGFGSVAATIGSMDAIVALGTAKTTLNQELGSIYISGLTVTLGGAVKVMAHSASGVTIDLNTLTVAISGNPTISWGDSDGIGGTTTAGYVGITGLAISGLTIAGQVSIDVATVDTNTALVTSAKALMYAAYVSHNLTPSFVHIGLGTGDANDALTSANTMAVGITSLAANVVLGSDKGLTAGVGTMGQLYIGNLSAKLNGWVDIAAH